MMAERQIRPSVRPSHLLTVVNTEGVTFSTVCRNADSRETTVALPLTVPLWAQQSDTRCVVVNELSCWLSFYRKKLQNLSHLNCGSKFAKFEFSWLQHVRTIAREGTQNTHHWSGRTETATANGVNQAGSCRHCGSHSSVASLIPPDQW